MIRSLLRLDSRLENACSRAIDIWGAAPQWRMLQEECGELIAAVNQYDRARITDEKLASEIVDVIIMLQQAIILLGFRGEPLVSAAIDEKLRRLEARLDKAKEIAK